MTNQEAINVLLNEQKCINRNDGTQCDRKCESCDLVMDAEQIREAYSMAISALEKQIPKEPKYKAEDRFVKNHFAEYTYCPVCDEEVVAGDMHCVQCGQAIDWEEE